MQLADLMNAMEQIAPTRHAEEWDNVGLLAGDPQQQIQRVLLCIDYTPAVAAEARSQNCQAVIAYHPPLFSPIKRITAGGSTELLYRAIRDGIALYSPHTALDVAEGGTNDLLADILQLQNRRPLRLPETKSTQCKLVTFVPEAHLETVAEALFAAGAGRIGNYSSCSFRSPGTGTFFGEAGTNPVVGQSGKLETAAEIRLETVVPLTKISAVVDALRKSHPYEEPAFDLNTLAAPPEGLGIGRFGTLASPTAAADLIDRIKGELRLPALLVAGATDRPVSTAAVCAGAGRDLLDDALAANADLYLTGEIPHHDALRAAAAGMLVLCTLHSNSERAALPRLRDRLVKELPNLKILLSEADRDPFTIG